MKRELAQPTILTIVTAGHGDPHHRLRRSLICTLLCTMVAGCADQSFLWSDQAKRSHESLEILKKNRDSIDSQVGSQQAAGALVGVTSPSAPQVLAFGDSAPLAGEHINGGLRCSDHPGTAMFFVYKRAIDLPVRRLSCETLTADIAHDIEMRNALKELRASVTQLQAKLESYDDEVKQNEEMLASDLKLTLYQQAYIKQHTKMLGRLSADLKNVFDRLSVLATSTAAEANANKAFLTEVRQKLDDIENQLKKF